MTLHELIEQLQELEASTGGHITVMSSSDYGDYTHTEQLNHIEEVSVVFPEKTAYSKSGLAVPDEEDDDREFDYEVRGSDREESEMIIALRYTN